ncbi:hypothetical protein ACSBR2_026709 [Camellia fascicularis]
MHVSVCKSGYQACGHRNLRNQFYLRVSVYRQNFGQNSVESTLIQLGSYWSEIQFKGNQCSFARGRVERPVRHRSSVQRSSDQRSLSISPVRSWAEISVSTSERGYTLVRLDQQSSIRMEEMMRQLQESMRTMQQNAARQAEFAKQQAEEDTDIPTGPAPPPILPQLSKAPTPTNLPDSPFEFETDPTALKVSKLEKLFKKSQGAHSIPDIEDRYTNSAVTLPDQFKMPYIDRFDGSGDPMVHLRLFSDILRPMGLTRLQKLSLFGRTLSGVAAI